MTPKTLTGSLQWKTYALMAPNVFFASLGNVLLGKGMKDIGEVRNWSSFLLTGLPLKVFTNGWIWLGIASLLLFLVTFMVVLSWADFSFVAPVAAISYPAATLMSHWVLGETVTALRWFGVVLICLGVGLVARTPTSTTEHD